MHVVPQPPQLAGSLVVSTHALLQVVRVPVQPEAHCPRSHTWLAPQAVPQAPQLCGSLRVSTQLPLHETS
jgi:hypothetical protein